MCTFFYKWCSLSLGNANFLEIPPTENFHKLKKKSVVLLFFLSRLVLYKIYLTILSPQSIANSSVMKTNLYVWMPIFISVLEYQFSTAPSSNSISQIWKPIIQKLPHYEANYRCFKSDNGTSPGIRWLEMGKTVPMILAEPRAHPSLQHPVTSIWS